MSRPNLVPAQPMSEPLQPMPTQVVAILMRHACTLEYISSHQALATTPIEYSPPVMV
jgi:hypothetical protein